jgi:hypothetical protein
LRALSVSVSLPPPPNMTTGTLSGKPSKTVKVSGPAPPNISTPPAGIGQ